MSYAVPDTDVMKDSFIRNSIDELRENVVNLCENPPPAVPALPGPALLSKPMNIKVTDENGKEETLVEVE